MLWFANGTAVTAKNEEDLQKMLRTIGKTLLNELNMKIS